MWIAVGGTPASVVRAGPHGALFAGSPQKVIDKILWEHQLLGHDRFLAQIGLGGLPFAETARSTELLATEVLPVIRRETSPEHVLQFGS